MKSQRSLIAPTLSDSPWRAAKLGGHSAGNVATGTRPDHGIFDPGECFTDENASYRRPRAAAALPYKSLASQMASGKRSMSPAWKAEP
jgi:hypothetical protein